MEEYLGTARDVRELVSILQKADQGACLEIRGLGLGSGWDYIEVYYDRQGDTIILK